MAGEIQLNSVTLATESGGTINFGSDVTLPYALQSEVFGTHTTGTITSGTNSLTVASGAGISNGDYVTGEGIPPGTTVSSGGGTTSITLSSNAAATLSSDPVSFYKSNKVLSPGLVAGALCRAWVNFYGGPSTSYIRASYNVSSITDYGTGDYTVNFTTAMADTNYVATGLGKEYDSTGVTSVNLYYGKQTISNTVAVGSLRVSTIAGASNTSTDCVMVSVAIFR